MEEEKQAEQEDHQAHEKHAVQIPEKKCLNCGALLRGHYCSQCGQRDEDLHEPFWKLFADALADFWHFDSKFFHTAYPLLLKPGFLTKEYVAGRRVRYVHPIRLYFFTSVVFFLFYFSFSIRNFINDNGTVTADSTTQKTLADVQDTLAKALGNKNVHLTLSPEKMDAGDSGVQQKGLLSANLPITIARYEDSIRKLPKERVPGYFQQLVDKKVIEAKQKGEKQVINEVIDTANHNLPKIMFVLLPIFALLLKLLYIRRKVYFVDHAVFSLHFHAFAFVVFLLAFGLMDMFTNLHLGNWITLTLLVYLFFALRKMHGQTIRKTLLKVFILLVSYSIFIGIGVIILIVYSALTF